MNLEQILAERLFRATDTGEAAPRPSTPAEPKPARRPMRTGVRAGDVYMHNPRGSGGRLDP
jgi:hypothetical protein